MLIVHHTINYKLSVTIFKFLVRPLFPLLQAILWPLNTHAGTIGVPGTGPLNIKHDTTVS